MVSITRIKEILKGIDKEDIYDDDAWFETAEGARYGKKKLDELIAYLLSEGAEE